MGNPNRILVLFFIIAQPVYAKGTKGTRSLNSFVERQKIGFRYLKHDLDIFQYLKSWKVMKESTYLRRSILVLFFIITQPVFAKATEDTRSLNFFVECQKIGFRYLKHDLDIF